MQQNNFNQQSPGQIQKERLQNLKDAQNSGEGLNKISGNRESKYELFEHDAHLTHVLIHEPQFDPQTGEDKGRKFVQVFDAKEFKRMSDNKESAFAGKKIKVLHDGSIAKQEAKNKKQSDSNADETPLVSTKNPDDKTPVTDPIDDLSYDQLKEKWAELYAGVEGVERPNKKVELIASIKERLDVIKGF